MSEKPAYRLADLAGKPFSRSFLYTEIAKGNLVARKAGRATIILAAEYDRFLNSRPPLLAKTREAA